jgi:hypothetical protein
VTPTGPGFCAALVAWLSLGLVAFGTIWLQRPPDPIPATAPAGEFSAERAFQHLKAIARSPRPIGSAGNAAARDYILQQLRAVSLEPEIQMTTAVSSIGAPMFFAGTIQNIVARRKGTGEGRAVLLVAHYDSVPTGPGANDDGAGVATLLETARALGASDQQLRNDIVFLFTDSEETGLLGARAFVAEHPWAKEVEVVLNFEARGIGGPVIMFETSPQNGALIRALAKATSYPLANSLSYEIYKRLPNDTDLTVFRRAGMPGMNFAYIHGLTHYHTELDNLENVDARTVQHHGSYALALSRHFGAAVPAVKPEGDAIYFDALGFFLVRYPVWLVWPLTVGTLLLFAAVTWFGFRRKELTVAGIAKGALLLFVNLFAAAAAVGGAWWLVQRIHPEYSLIALGDSYSHGHYVIGFALLTLATSAAILSPFHRRIGGPDLFVGALLWWAALMIAATKWVIGGSYLLTWPLFFALLGLATDFVCPKLRPALKPGIVSLCAIPGILLVVPLVHLTFIAVPFALAPGLVLLLVLLWALLIPLLRSSTAGNRWAFPGFVAAIAVLFFLLAGLGAGFDKDHRQSNHVLYTLDAATQRARWVSLDARPDEWTEQFFGKNPERGPLENSFPLGRRTYLQAPAPSASFKPPDVQVLEDVAAADGVRRLRLRLVSPRGAERLSVQITAAILSVAVNGKPLISSDPTSVPQTRCSFLYVALPKAGIELVLETRSNSSLALRLVDESYGLPLLDGATLSDRPAHMMPAPAFRSDFSLVSQNYSF